jgi:hypothetical protein
MEGGFSNEILQTGSESAIYVFNDSKVIATRAGFRYRRRL